MQVRPLTPARLLDELAEQIAGHLPDRRIAVAVDGPEVAAPERLAEGLVDPLRVRGRPARHFWSGDFLLPASLRFEQGRTNAESFYHRWVDADGLRREVLERLDSGEVLPSLRDPVADRATREAYVAVPPGAVVLVSGPLLLGGALSFDLAIHLLVSQEALQRRTPPQRAWTLPAYDRYAAEVAPASWADVVVRLDDPDRPAVVDAW